MVGARPSQWPCFREKFVEFVSAPPSGNPPAAGALKTTRNWRTAEPLTWGRFAANATDSILKDIVSAQPLAAYRLHLRFEDGVEGDVDVSELVRFDGVFTALRDHAFFELVRVNRDLGAIYWPNGADLDPDVLYSRITGIPLPSFEAKPSR